MELRKLDALIHEKVLGLKPSTSWEILNEDESATMLSFDYRSEAEQWFAAHVAKFPHYSKTHHVGQWKHYPQYSSKASNSQFLREKLAEKWTAEDRGSWEFRREINGMFRFAIFTATEPWTVVGIAHTEELAVAIAALRSVGIKETE